MKIASALYSLAEVAAHSPEWRFNVPIYQRLYVWGDDQVLTLLNDIVNAYERDEELFFLGGTLLVEQEGSDGRHFDLIDGQQRFTTLWMLCHAWRGALEPFLSVSEGTAATSRLRFAIRPEVDRFLNKLAFGDRGQSAPDEEATKRMRTALALMDAVFEKRPLPTGVSSAREHLAGLARFVFEKVKFVITTVPRQTDLNKLFEVINNRGVQLQHHEILKAKMLDALTEGEREAYAVLWDASADMENYVERSLAGVSGLPASDVTDSYDRRELAKADAVRRMIAKRMKAHAGHHALGLAEILNSVEEPKGAEVGPAAGTEESEPTWVRSIFGFPLFLQHVLRIWLLESGRGDLPRLLDRELLDIFEAHFFAATGIRAQNVRTFIDLLWRLRVMFDERIIKWADQGDEEAHLISAITVSTSSGKRYLSRSRETDAHRGFAMLQSMLYHSQEITTQYWLTPLLTFMHRHPQAGLPRCFEYLRHLDNHLLGSSGDEPLVVRSLAFMRDPWRRCELVHDKALAQPSGVKFAHYWFYKLEFVLWHQSKRTTERWKKFRLTAKSSVEHISPQTPTDRDDNRVVDALDHFGNLALVSRSLNSEYGNLPYNEKRQRFQNANRTRIDSLKMDLIYDHETWNDDKALAHQAEMIACLNAYCNATPGQ